MGRMPRRNEWAEEACYHLMNRGHNREAVSSMTKTATPSWAWWIGTASALASGCITIV